MKEDRANLQPSTGDDVQRESETQNQLGLHREFKISLSYIERLTEIHGEKIKKKREREEEERT